MTNKELAKEILEEIAKLKEDLRRQRKTLLLFQENIEKARITLEGMTPLLVTNLGYTVERS